MKQIAISMLALLALGFSVNAQNKTGNKRHHMHHNKGMRANELNLSDAQQAQAKKINDDFRKKMQELNKNESITVKEQRNRKAALLKDKKTQMDGILTSEQKAKKAQLKADRKIKNDERYTARMARMKTNLNLSDDQVSKLKSQRAATQARAEQIKNNETLSREQKKNQMMALKAEGKAQKDRIFTADQKVKMEELRKNRDIRNKKGNNTNTRK